MQKKAHKIGSVKAWQETGIQSALGELQKAVLMLKGQTDQNLSVIAPCPAWPIQAARKRVCAKESHILSTLLSVEVVLQVLLPIGCVFGLQA